MANTRIQHTTLVANTAKEITLNGNYASVEVVNRDDTAEVFARLDTTNPTVNGDDSEIIPPRSVLVIPSPKLTDPTVVRLISSGTPAVSVKGK